MSGLADEKISLGLGNLEGGPPEPEPVREPLPVEQKPVAKPAPVDAEART